MKKIIAVVLMLVSVIALFAGCSSNKQSFTQKNYEADGTQVKEISIDVRDRKIEVSLSKDNQIHIEYAESEKEYYDIAVSDNNVLTMTANTDKEWSDFIGAKPDAENRKINLQIPDLLLTSLKLSTTNEDIRLSALNVTEAIILSSNGGNISFEKINAGSNISLTVKNGNIAGSIARGYDDYNIACEIKKGESNLPSEKTGGSKNLSVNANNGDVKIEFYK